LPWLSDDSEHLSIKLCRIRPAVTDMHKIKRDGILLG
jgi:hypothetical protein